MKKSIVILSLIAIFVSVNVLTAQTKPVAKTTTQTEVKSEKKDVAPAASTSKEHSSSDCKKAKSHGDRENCSGKCAETCSKELAKVDGKACCDGKAKTCDKKGDAKKTCCDKKI
jgi:hypothetical protein